MMQQTMRWYGPQDPVRLQDIRQCGVQGIVTALHEIPVGDIWSVEAIENRQRLLQKEGLTWAVVESLPVHEEIKRGSPECSRYIHNYITSLKNLGHCGIEVVAYNFMPILDWVRTDVLFPNQDGTKTLLFDKIAFAYFDVFLLQRPFAHESYSKDELEKAKLFGASLTEDEKEKLVRTVTLGLPGSKENFTKEQLLLLLKDYQKIDRKALTNNLIQFLAEVTPVAEGLGMRLAIHPDDPPFSVLGLPRIVSTSFDIKTIFKAVPSPANGLCFCTGSFGARPENDLLSMIHDFGNRIHFLHLRNVHRSNSEVFQESEHLSGDHPMEAILEQLLLLMHKEGRSIPMRPDHGFLHDFELGPAYFSGYSLIGRLKGLAELRGLEKGLRFKLGI